MPLNERWLHHGILAALLAACSSSPDGSAPGCDLDLSLPTGFCAQVFADDLGALRHIGVSSNGDVYVARMATDDHTGGLVALRDTNADGRADLTQALPNSGGTGLVVTDDVIYMSTWTEVLRYRRRPAVLLPDAAPDTVLLGLPESGHGARSLVLETPDRLLVNIGAPTNSCQVADKQLGSPGRDPCPELESFAGVWRFDARRSTQRQADGHRVVSGVRHLVAMALHPSGTVYAAQHGRDDLREAFPSLYDEIAGADLAAEELFLLEEGRNYGWPYCYYDGIKRIKVLAPEYGGDGTRTDRCTSAAPPVYAFPAHWAPNGLLFYRGTMFPARYRGGAFVAFHGGWYRPPPDNGFNVVFLPFDGDRPAGRHEVFADGFAGKNRQPSRARHRPVGLAEGPDGALFITDDVRGRIWRVVYRPPV